MEMYKVNVFSPMILTKYVIRDMMLNKTKGYSSFLQSVFTQDTRFENAASTKGSLKHLVKTHQENGKNRDKI